ncbi:MAG TPA: PIN domain-containing protein [Longimicrobiaceae bacterium]|nr:PIN domain-containing protein [Longimicrobiaceae bacterium]
MDRLAGRRLALDSPAFIYHLEKNPRYLAVTRQVLGILAENRGSGVASTLVLMEALVGPLRQGLADRAESMIRFIGGLRGLDLVPMDAEVSKRAAEVRSRTGLSTPDAIHAATALARGAEIFITNDRAFRRVDGFDVLLLDELVP